MRVLHAFINDRKVGEVRDDNGIWSFAYDRRWLEAEDAYGLSPALPLAQEPLVDSSSKRPVQWYFDNLLPEEGARVLLAKDAGLEADDAFGLLAHYGQESAGSLTLSVEAEAARPEGSRRPLPDAALAARIANLPRVSLAAGAPKRMSLAGAQHKLAVIYEDGELFEPAGQTPSTHILKPDHRDPDYPHSVINEYFVMRLGRALSLDVPRVFRRYVPAPIYLIERFDRRATSTGVRRLHVIDACQALNLDRQFKYTQGRIERLAELAGATAAPAAARVRLYSWLVFNLLVGNSDAHLKNLSFFVERDGIRLAPYYDVLAVGVYETRAYGKDTWPSTRFAWPLCGANSFEDLGRATLLEAAGLLGLNRETAMRLLDVQAARIEAAARDLLEEVLMENAKLLHLPEDLAPVLAGEVRCLRAIVQVVIRDMAARLAR